MTLEHPLKEKIENIKIHYCPTFSLECIETLMIITRLKEKIIYRFEI